MSTPSTMILRSLVLIGEKTLGGTLTSAEETAYLAALNTMMESWSLERLLVYQILDETFSLTAGDGSYTIGSGADFNTVRPNKIDGALIRDANNSDSPVDIVDADEWRTIQQKTSTGSTYPCYLYYNPVYPNGVINLYPEPQAGLSLVISTWKQLQTFALISTTVSLPPGYERAIVYNFAIEVAGGFIEPAPSVVKIARESKAAIKRINIPKLTMSLPAMPGVRHGGGNIFTGP